MNSEEAKETVTRLEKFDKDEDFDFGRYVYAIGRYPFEEDEYKIIELSEPYPLKISIDYHKAPGIYNKLKIETTPEGWREHRHYSRYLISDLVTLRDFKTSVVDINTKEELEDVSLKYDYYIIGKRPVKISLDPKDNDELHTYVLNWDTCEFEINHDYSSRIHFPHMEESNISVFDINKVDEATFNKQVRKIKDSKKEKVVIKGEEFTVRSYYTVGDRPVKILVDEDGLKAGALALNWETCEFEVNIHYMFEVSNYNRDSEIDEHSRKEFEEIVQNIKDRKSKRPSCNKEEESTITDKPEV